MTVRRIQDIHPTFVRRLPTGFPELSWIYGLTRVGNQSTWGIPEGKISLWKGKEGVGKSRLAVELARKVARNPSRYRVLYIQSEVDENTFASLVKSDKKPVPDTFYISSSTSLPWQLRNIRTVRPHLVFIDSVNMLSEFRNGSDSNIKTIIDTYRTACNETGCHIIILSQITKTGKVRGSTTLVHLVDSVFKVQKEASDGFLIQPIKHRYGRTGPDFTCVWVHRENGVECASNWRTWDKLWCQTTGEKFFDVAAHGEALRQYYVFQYNTEFDPWWKKLINLRKMRALKKKLESYD